jgi:hypothetical protein
MKKIRAALVAATVLIAAGVALHAVTFGEPDGKRHPYVGAIIFETPSGFFSCSATLMSPTVLLTAGHCTEEAGIANFNTWVKFTPVIDFPNRSAYPTLAAYLDDKKNGWIKGQAIAHPQYDDFAQFPETFDVGVVLLDKRVTMDTYGALPTRNFLSGIKTAADNRFTVVGYGLQGLIRPFAEDKFERYQGQVKLLELNSTSNAGQSAKFSNNPGTSGGSCFGDSGGPVFYGSTNMVVAVVSWGITPCIGVDYQFRVDTATTLDFVRPFLR